MNVIEKKTTLNPVKKKISVNTIINSKCHWWGGVGVDGGNAVVSRRERGCE